MWCKRSSGQETIAFIDSWDAEKKAIAADAKAKAEAAAAATQKKIDEMARKKAEAETKEEVCAQRRSLKGIMYLSLLHRCHANFEIILTRLSRQNSFSIFESPKI